MNDSPPCDVCGAAMYALHCKLICRNCGYRRDCSDPHHAAVIWLRGGIRLRGWTWLRGGTWLRRAEVRR